MMAYKLKKSKRRHCRLPKFKSHG